MRALTEFRLDHFRRGSSHSAGSSHHMRRRRRSGGKEGERGFLLCFCWAREGGARSPKLDEAAGPCDCCWVWIPTEAARLEAPVFKTSGPVLTNWAPHEHHPTRLYPTSVLQPYYFRGGCESSLWEGSRRVLLRCDFPAVRYVQPAERAVGEAATRSSSEVSVRRRSQQGL